MIREANQKFIYALASGSVATNATATTSIDCKGYDYATIAVHANVTNAASTLKVEQSDDDSTWVAAGITGGTDFTIGTHGTATTLTTPYYLIQVDTRGLKRYLKLSVTPGASATVVGYATLGRRQDGAGTTGAGTVDARNVFAV